MNSATKMPLDVCAAAAGSAFACQFEEPANSAARGWMLWSAAAAAVVSLLLVAIF